MSEIDITDKVNDAVNLCRLRSIPRFVGFLSPEQCSAVLPLLSKTEHRFFGGYENAERTVLGVFPEWCDKLSESYPIVPLTFSFRTADKLSHRDFLGTVMSLGVERRTVGDILIGSGTATMFVLKDVSEFIITQISKVGGVGVSISVGIPETLPGQSEMHSFSATMASNRLDSVVSCLVGKSRGTAADLVENGSVSVNSVLVQKLAHRVQSGDALSIRNFGKYIIDSLDEHSKKGRLILKWKKYM